MITNVLSNIEMLVVTLIEKISSKLKKLMTYPKAIFKLFGV